MKKIKYYIFILMLSSLFMSCLSDRDKFENELRKLAEMSYFEGQRDALENDVRIKRNKDGCWIWTKSPWDSNSEPEFDPSFNCK